MIDVRSISFLYLLMMARVPMLISAELLRGLLSSCACVVIVSRHELPRGSVMRQRAVVELPAAKLEMEKR